MDKRTYGLSLVLSLTLALHASAGLAGTLAITPAAAGAKATIRGEIPLERLGNIPVPRGRVDIDGNRLAVTMIQEWLFDRQVVLSGLIIKIAVKARSGRGEAEGVVYFQEGDWLKYIDGPGATERVVTDDSVFVGRIKAMTAEEITLEDREGTTKIISVDALKEIHSPRAYSFTIPLVAVASPAGAPLSGQATSMTMRPMARPLQLASLRAELRQQGDRDLTTGEIMMIGTGLSFAQLGQMVPFLIVPLTYDHLRRIADRKQAPFIEDQNRPPGQ